MRNVGPASESVCVVHLVWAPLGLEPFRRFVASYRANPGGTAHRLLVVYNGFAPGDGRDPYRRELEGVAHEELVLPHPVQDIAAYFAATAAAPEAEVCFLNSYSVLLDPRWLSKMQGALRTPGTGLVGATGSWASLRSLRQLHCGAGGAYRGLFARLAPDGPPPPRFGPPLEFLRRPWLWLKDLRRWQRTWTRFGPFPVWHLRTNAFMLRRETMLRTRPRHLRHKLDALTYESGKASLTAQVLAAGGRVLVVGRDGVGYEPARWPESRTFWQDGQENVLVSDNQTRLYDGGDAALRRYCARFAWGSLGRP